MRKQSLFQRPNFWMSQRGKPEAAAVEAAPILNECVENGFCCVGDNASCRILLSRRRVRKVLSENVNSGPVLVGWLLMKWISADVGHKALDVGDSRITQPCRKGSHLDSFISMEIWS